MGGRGDLLVPAGLSGLCVPQDHDVQEDRIFLLSLLMAEMGVHSVAYAFPRVRIITTAVDKRINEEFHIIPGIGEGGQGCAVPRGPPAAPWVPCGRAEGALGGGNCRGAGAAVASLCPLVLQVTLGTGTLAPTAPPPGVRATAWTAEQPRGHRPGWPRGRPPTSAPRRGSANPHPAAGRAPRCQHLPPRCPSSPRRRRRRDGVSCGLGGQRGCSSPPKPPSAPRPAAHAGGRGGVAPVAGHPLPWGVGEGVRSPRAPPLGAGQAPLLESVFI